MTFEEWYKNYGSVLHDNVFVYEDCWNAATEDMQDKLDAKDKEIEALKKDFEKKLDARYDAGYEDAKDLMDNKITQLSRQIYSLTELVKAYRAKRKVDGLNGRMWNAMQHLDAEELVKKLESEICKN
jgi:hypothetical protein